MRQRVEVALLTTIVILCGLAAVIWTRASDTSRSIRSGAAHLPLPDGDAPEGTVRFVALGDMGTGDDAQLAVARQMAFFQLTRPYDTILTLGDNIYPDGNPADIPKKFEQPYAALLKRGVNFYASLGNHDVRKGREAQINYRQFNMGGRSYYSFTKGAKGDGLVEFFALDSTKFDATQAQWLEQALAASKARWRIAYFHHPIYSSGDTHGSDLKLRARLEPLLVNYGVAAVFSGHDHTYERTKLQQGVQYFVSGAGGKLRRGDLNDQSRLMAAGNDDHNSFMFVELDQESMKFWAVDAAGLVIDSGALAPRFANKRAAASQ